MVLTGSLKDVDLYTNVASYLNWKKKKKHDLHFFIFMITLLAWWLDLSFQTEIIFGIVGAQGGVYVLLHSGHGP